MRPSYNDYPKDTVSSYASFYDSHLSNPSALVIVAEALHGSALVIVGVSTWYLPDGPTRAYTDQSVTVRNRPKSKHRDVLKSRLRRLAQIQEEAQGKYAFQFATALYRQLADISCFSSF